MKIEISKVKYVIVFIYTILLSFLTGNQNCRAVSVILGEYSFDGTLTPSNTDPDVTFSNWTEIFPRSSTFVDGIGSAPDQGFQSGHWTGNTSDINTATSYWEFSVTINNPVVLDLDKLTFSVRGNGQGAAPDTLTAGIKLSSEANFTSIGTDGYDTSTTTAYQPITLGFPTGYETVSEDFDIRVAAYGASDTNGGKVDIDAFSFNVTEEIPFKFSPTLGLIISALLFSSSRVLKKYRISKK